MEVLLIEDDRAIADSLRRGLERYGYSIVWVQTATDALRVHADPTCTPEIILLDLGLPDGDGLDVCRTIRETTNTPILVLSARDSETDRVVGLELGADDYISKPFGVREVIARMRAVMRRVRSGAEIPGPPDPGAHAVLSGAPPSARAADVASSEPAGAQVTPPVGRFSIDERTRRAWVGDREVALTAKEFDLLAYLASDLGAAKSREDIMRAVWDEHWFGPTKTLDVHIRSLRMKLGGAAFIETLRGVGYRMVTP